MRFYDTSNTHDSLVHMCNGLIGTNITTYALADQARAANRWISTVLGWIFEVEGTFEFDDPNYTDFPYATFNLVDNQQDYALPAATDGGQATTLLAVIGISIKSSAGLWQKLRLINDWSKIGIDRYEYKKTKGMPDEFDLFGNSMFLFSPPDTTMVTATAGGRAYFSRAQDLLTASDTTQQPPFVSIFHPVVAYGMAYEYAVANLRDSGIDKELLTHIYGGVIAGAQVDGYKNQIQKLYANRNKTERVRLTPSRAERRQYR